MRSPGWLALLLAAGCGGAGAFACDQSSDCIDGAVAGTCEPSGFCSFPDPDCPSSQRYGGHAGDGLAGECVDDGGTSTAASETSGPSGSVTLEGGSDPTATSVDASGAATDLDGSASGVEGTTSDVDGGTSHPESTGESSLTVTDSAGSDGDVAICGNRIVEPGETCDKDDLGGASCESLGLGVGDLDCEDCEHDISKCCPECGSSYAPCEPEEGNESCDDAVALCYQSPQSENGTCLPSCEAAADCPPIEGAAPPLCIANACFVPCAQGECPDALKCEPTMMGDVCLW